MKRVIFGVLMLGLMLAPAFDAPMAEEKVEVKEKIRGDTVTTVEKVEGPDMKSKTKTDITTKGDEVTVKKVEKVKTPEGKRKIKSETVLSSGGVAKRIRIDTTKKGEGKQRVEAGGIVTPEGDRIEFAKVKHEGKHMGKLKGKFVEYNKDKMTIIVEKGNYDIVLPASGGDEWRIKPGKMKKGEPVVIYSTYDPKLIQHIVSDAESGKTIGKQ